MYVHPAFKIHHAVGLAFAAARGFGHVIASEGGRPVGALLMESIVAIEMTVETVEGSFKLNQHKADADHVAVVRALREQDRPSAHAIAARMVALRPHLAYE